MTKQEYDELNKFPMMMVSLVEYESEKTRLKKGDEFIGVKKEKIGEWDYSIIDSNGHPHYYEGCDLMDKNKQ